MHQEQAAQQNPDLSLALDSPAGTLGLYNDPDNLDVMQCELAEPDPIPPSQLNDMDTADFILTQFDAKPGKATFTEIFSHCHQILFIQILMIVFAVLHVRHNVSFQACSILLSSLSAVLLYLRLVPTDDPSQNIPITFATVIKRLGIEDQFRTYPVCYVTAAMASSRALHLLLHNVTNAPNHYIIHPLVRFSSVSLGKSHHLRLSFAQCHYKHCHLFYRTSLCKMEWRMLSSYGRCVSP